MSFVLQYNYIYSPDIYKALSLCYNELEVIDMKKALLIFLLLMCVSIFPSYASEEITVLIPDYDFIIEDTSFYYQDSQYPVLSYKDITYFPMTYEYCRLLDVSTAWVDGEGLFIASHPSSFNEAPSYPTAQNAKYSKAVIPTYDIYVNGKKIDQKAEEYPLFNYRGVTYFPLTWRFGTEEFYWNIDFKEGENRSLTITSYQRGFGSTMTVYEVADDYAVIHNPEDDNFLRLDFNTDEVTVAEGYDKPFPSYQTPIETERKLEIKDNRFVIDGTPLAQIEVLANGTVTEDELEPSYYEYTTGDGHFLQLHAYYNMEIPAPYTPYERYTYIVHNGNFIQLPGNIAVQNAIKADDGSLYISYERYSGYRGSTILHNHLYRLMPDGTLIYINDLFPDYGSMELIGKANGKLYLKCEWMPEEQLINGVFDEYSISPYNDGYYTYDGEKLSLIHRYTYSDRCIVAPNGKLYTIAEQFKKIEKIN